MRFGAFNSKLTTCHYMNAKQFYDEVVKLRRLQKEYFRIRSSGTLRTCKKQEKLIDSEIDRVERLIQKHRNTNLFGHETDKQETSTVE
jgi:hypothetical protein